MQEKSVLIFPGFFRKIFLHPILSKNIEKDEGHKGYWYNLGGVREFVPETDEKRMFGDIKTLKQALKNQEDKVNKDITRIVRYSIFMHIFFCFTIYPLFCIPYIFSFYISKYYYWHRYDIHFPAFAID